MSRALLAALCGACLLASCADPVHDNEVAALGPEAPGVSPGPTHRPGQPCLVCHGGSGPGSPQFAIAGTIDQAQTSGTPLAGGTVSITDANLVTKTATTNGVGNFYFTIDQWDPGYPLHCEVAFQGTSAVMTTHVGRDGSCASCHFDPAGKTSPGHVYLVLDPADLPGASP